MEKHKTIIKTADTIRQSLIDLQHQQSLHSHTQLVSYLFKLKELERHSCRLGKAIEKGWLAAAEQCTQNTSRMLNEISYSVERMKQFTNREKPTVPTLKTLVDELWQMELECEKVQFNLGEKTLSVITEPIELDGIYLGPFEISLQLFRLKELYTNAPYVIIALDPHPAQTADDVPHPHVSNQQLCEGDGYTAIRIALEQGRLCDFFTMVQNILTTYNPDSPYVRLEDWEGRPCYDCGYTLSQDESYYCEYCDQSFCGQCSTYCQKCDVTICLGCAYECPACEEAVCRNCTAQCSECHDVYCKECLTQDRLCPTCDQQRKDHDNEDHQKEDPNLKTLETLDSGQRPVLPAGPSVQPDRLGQAVVLQGPQRQ